MSEHLAKLDPNNPGFDPGEPNAPGLLVFIVGAAAILLAVFIGVTGFWGWALDRQEGEVLLGKPSEDLAALHSREDQQMNTYGFINKEKGVVQIPLERAMQLVTKEAAEGKLKYSMAPTPVKKVEPGATADGAAAPAPGTTPAAAAPASKN